MKKNQILLRITLLLGFFLLPTNIFAATCTPPINGDLTIAGDCSFSGTVNGVDQGTGTTNIATLTVNSGILTIASNQKIAFGTIIVNGGVIALPIDNSASLLPNTPLWMPDADGDHYPESTIQDATSQPPSGTSKRRSTLTSETTIDCYDSNPSVFPGQTGFFTTDRGDGSFDYDCDGVETKARDDCTCSCSNDCASAPVCTLTIVGDATPCGATGVDAGASLCSRTGLYGGGCGTCVGSGSTPAVLMCR